MLEKEDPKVAALNSAASPGEVKYAEKNGDAKLDIGNLTEPHIFFQTN